MNFTLLRTQRALRFVPFAAGLAAVTLWTFVSSEHEAHVVTAVHSSPAHLYAKLHEWIWFALAIVAPAVFPGVRIANYERALPVRPVWALGARMIAFAVVLAAPVTVSLVLHAIYRPEVLDVASLAIVVPTWLVVIGSTTMWVFVSFPSRSDLDGWRQVLVGGVGAVLLMLPTYVFSPWIAVPYAVFAAILVQLFSRPTSYLHGSHESLNAPAATERTPRRRFEVDPLRWTLMFSTFLRPQVVPGLLGCTLILGVMGTSSTSNKLFGTMMVGVVMTVPISVALQCLRGFDALPMSRLRVLRYVSLPPLYAVTLGLTLWHFVPAPHMFYAPFDRGVQFERSTESTLEGKADYDLRLRLSPEHWIVTHGAFRIESPWGEVHEPTPHPLLPGAALRVVNPYSVGDENSVQFLAWQLSRALEVVYGVHIGTEELHARWLAHLELDARAESVAVQYLHRFKNWDGIDTPLRAHARDLGFLALIAVALWFMAMLWVLRPNVPGLTRRAWLGGRLRDFGIPLLVVGAFFSLTGLNPDDPALLPVLFASLRGAIDTLVGGSVIGWIVLDVSAVFACLTVLGWRIERIETPKQMLVGWSRKPASAF